MLYGFIFLLDSDSHDLQHDYLFNICCSKFIRCFIFFYNFRNKSNLVLFLELY